MTTELSRTSTKVIPSTLSPTLIRRSFTIAEHWPKLARAITPLIFTLGHETGTVGATALVGMGCATAAPPAGVGMEIDSDGLPPASVVGTTVGTVFTRFSRGTTGWMSVRDSCTAVFIDSTEAAIFAVLRIIPSGDRESADLTSVGLTTGGAGAAAVEGGGGVSAGDLVDVFTATSAPLVAGNSGLAIPLSLAGRGEKTPRN